MMEKRGAELKAERESAIKQMRIDFAKVASTDAGKAVLRFFMAQCGFISPSTTFSKETGEILPFQTIYSEARRNIWIEARGYLEYEARVTVENPRPKTGDEQ